MRLKHNSTGANHLSPLPPLIARRTDLIKPAMGSRQGVRLRQRALAGRLLWFHPHRPPPTARLSDQTSHQEKETVCEQADPFEKAFAGLPQEADQGQQENGTGLSDGATGCDQRGP